MTYWDLWLDSCLILVSNLGQSTKLCNAKDCEKVFPDKKAYELHWDQEHAEILMKKCRYCDFESRQFWLFRKQFEQVIHLLPITIQELSVSDLSDKEAYYAYYASLLSEPK